MAVAFIDTKILWRSRKPDQLVLDAADAVGIHGRNYRGLHFESDGRTGGGIGNRVGGVLVQHTAMAADVHSLHREPVVLLARDRNRDHGNDLSLLDENPGAGVGVCGPADAGVVHILSGVVAAEVDAGHRVDDADGAFVRRDAPGSGW